LKPRLLITFLLLLLVPLGALGALGTKIVNDERVVARQQRLTWWQERLLAEQGRVATIIEDTARALSAAIPENLNVEPDVLRTLSRKEPLIRQVFVLGQNGKLVFPTQNPTTSAEEKAFLERTADIWEGRAILYSSAREEGAATTVRTRGDSLLALSASQNEGWLSWHWREGQHVLYWRAIPGGVVGVEVERVLLWSKIVGKMPVTPVQEGRIVLRDARGEPIHQWGPHEPQNQRPAVSVALLPPLESLHLDFYPSPAQSQGFYGGVLGLGVGLMAGGLILGFLILALYFWRESSRELREAAQRVGFVTQVSHELKTPLANIQLYAELSAENLEDDPTASHHLQVIISECQRLGRLIDNVLTFAKQRRGTLALKKEPVAADRVIQEVLEHFGPALSAKKIQVEAQLSSAQVSGDADAVGQVVANLVSNVEKYGASGGYLGIYLEPGPEVTKIQVKDRGPGIPKSLRQRVFQPFYRIGNQLNEGVSGTGLGLAIARELAQAMGGELVVLDAGPGACFELRLSTWRT